MTTDIAVYVLSRGQGVPEKTQRVFQEIRSLLASERSRGLVVRLNEERIGLEGETRLCAVFRDGDAAAAAFSRLQALANTTELLRVVHESCPQT